MKLLHVTATISKRGGGVAAYLHQLLEEHAKAGCQIDLFAIDDAQTQADTESLAQSVQITTRPPTGPRSLGWSRGLIEPLKNAIENADLVHLHGLRSLLNRDARRIAKQHNRPLIISPHGQLYPQVLERNPLRKRVLAKLFVDRTLHQATCLHATSKTEADHLRAYGLRQPIAVVPIGVDLEQYHTETETASAAIDHAYPTLQGKKRLLFLSLLHPKKGLLRLAEAWSQLATQHPDWSLVIAGPDDGFETQAHAAFDAQCPSDSVAWLGPVYHQAKHNLLAGCDVVVLPSDWENFGIVVIEALASKTPVIATHDAPWQQLNAESCGWWIEPTAAALTETLHKAMSCSDADRQAMGQRGRALIESQYTWSRCAAQMLELYQALATQAPWPTFVQTLDE